MTTWNKIDEGTPALLALPYDAGALEAEQYGSINAAVAAIGAETRTLVVSTPMALTANLTVPANVHLVGRFGGGLVKASTYTVAINGPFEAGRYQFFYEFSAGDVTFGSGAVKRVYPEWFGAKGDGVTDDTTAMNIALAAGKNFRTAPGNTYLINGNLSSSYVQALIDCSNSTIKLKNSATNKGMLSVNGADSAVIGGIWDQNGSNNSTGDQYGHYAVLLNADRTIVRDIYSKNSYGLGIKGGAGKNYLKIFSNRIEAAQLMGIYVDASASDSADIYGTKILNNIVDVSVYPAALGIYLASYSSWTYLQKKWEIRNNLVLGSVDANTTAVGITARGVEGIVTENQVIGTTIGISVDMSANTRSIVSKNRVEDIKGSTAYGIEYNGAYGVISDNYIKGGKYGIVSSSSGSPSLSMDGNSYTNNILEEQTSRALYIAATSGGKHANYLNIQGNTILMSTASPIAGVNLAGDCRYSKITGNVFQGPGAAVANSRAIYLDTVNSNISITDNRFDGWERATGVYNASAVAQTLIVFANNDVSRNIGNSGASALLNLEGSATWGDGVAIIGNFRGLGANPQDDILDRSSNIIRRISNAYSTPEGNVTANIGSVYIKNTGSAPLLYIKETGTGNTGWVGK